MEGKLKLRLFFLLAATLGLSGLYMSLGFEARNERVFRYILNLRLEKLQAMILVGASLGAGTVAFMTVVQNRILTPSVLGFDALFVALQTSLVFSFGAQFYSALPAELMFIGEAALLALFSTGLILLVLRATGGDVQLLLLCGLVLALFFRSLTFFVQRLIDPTEFAVLQDAGFASFATVNPAQLGLAWIFMVFALAVLWLFATRLDVMALGRATALSLGERYERQQILVLLTVSVLVAVATSLVGPILFLGLIVATMTHAIFPTHHHRILLPASALLGVAALLVGQTLLQRVINVELNIGILIEFIGGGLLLLLILRGALRS